MPRKKVEPPVVPRVKIEQFEYEDRTYQIDPLKRKVYRRFVEIETSRAAELVSIWRAQKVEV